MLHRLILCLALLSPPLMGADVHHPDAAVPGPVRVLVWDEQQPEQRRAYGEKFLGETIAAHLSARPGFMVKSVSLASPEQGLDEATLNATDVVIWWSHQKNPFVTDENVERLVTRVREGKLGFIALHSAHWARPFVRLMQERAKDDALAQIPSADRATAKFEYFNQNPLGKVPRRDAPLTPALRQEDGVWKLTLPGCIFPAYRGDGAPSHVTMLLPDHPIAVGVPVKWDVKQTEMYDEPFHVPTPDAVVFEERWDKGEHFRSGCVWQVGQGRVFYFRPGHETFPVFQQAEPLRVVENAARWVAPVNHQTNSIEGWTVLINERLLTEDKAGTAKALVLLRAQLQEIVRVMPASAVAKLREVTLWFSPEYPGVPPRAEYHPGAGWLRDQGRDPALAKGVEFTDVRNFEAETRRMPNFTLHELSHAYHDRVLAGGFDNAEIKAAYERAKAGGLYDRVERWFGNGRPNTKEKAYAMTNPMEYFAETTEAYFSRNDFFPFTHDELKRHDSEMEQLLARLWGVTK